MGEPAFYKCNTCRRTWQRWEAKASPNPPRVCPHCGAGPEAQGQDDVREREYMRIVYGMAADVLTGEDEKGGGRG